MATIRIKFSDGYVTDGTLTPDQPLRIGSSFACDVEVPEPGVAEVHCEIVFTDGGYRVSATEEGRGIHLNGKAVKTLDEVKQLHDEAVENIRTKTRAVFTVLRNGSMRQLVIEYSRDYDKE